MVPFSAFSHYSTSTTPTSVNHTGTSISTSFSYNLPEGEALSIGHGGHRADDGAHPHAHQHPWQPYGTARAVPAVQSSSEPLILLAALVAIYVVLGMLYESFTQPLTIISTLPSAGLGALLALMLTNTELSLVAFLGIMLLIGIVKKNAIMMVDFALDAERNLGLVSRDAIARACSLRFRPIMMTTCAAIAGALPLALSTRRWHRIAPPAGYFHRGRSHRQPAADALHHARWSTCMCAASAPSAARASSSRSAWHRAAADGELPRDPAHSCRILEAQPRPMKGILVAMMVMN